MHETDSGISGRTNETTGPRLYTVREAAAELRLSRATIFRLIAEDKLGSEKNGGRRLIPSEAIEAFRLGGSKPAVYTPAQAAGQLNVAEGWLTAQAEARAVPHTRLGNEIRFTAEHIQQIVAAYEVRPAAPLKTA